MACRWHQVLVDVSGGGARCHSVSCLFKRFAMFHTPFTLITSATAPRLSDHHRTEPWHSPCQPVTAPVVAFPGVNNLAGCSVLTGLTAALWRNPWRWEFCHHSAQFSAVEKTARCRVPASIPGRSLRPPPSMTSAAVLASFVPDHFTRPAGLGDGINLASFRVELICAGS